MNYAHNSAATTPKALHFLIGTPLVTQTEAGVANIELQFVGGGKLLIVLDNETRQAVALALHRSGNNEATP